MKPHALWITFALLFVCLAARAESLWIDHTIVAVHDLEDAIANYEGLGFTIKPGRPHKNGLLNAHIKFADKTALELMSLIATPTDAVAKAYASFLKAGEGGAYIAFSGIKIREIETLLNIHAVEHETVRGRLWDYLVFPEGSGKEHIFFIVMHTIVSDDAWAIKHDNGATAIARIWVEGDRRLTRLLNLLGAKPCDIGSRRHEVSGTVYRIANKELVVIPPQQPNRRLRILGIGFDQVNSAPKDSDLEANGIRIEFAADPHCDPNEGHSAWVPNQGTIQTIRGIFSIMAANMAIMSGSTSLPQKPNGLTPLMIGDAD